MNQGLVSLAGFCSKQLKLYFCFLDKKTCHEYSEGDFTGITWVAPDKQSRDSPEFPQRHLSADGLWNNSGLRRNENILLPSPETSSAVNEANTTTLRKEILVAGWQLKLLKVKYSVSGQNQYKRVNTILI
ncbi:hypothetical protein P5673_023315 [Acropora cervicornis]|uniref:Uncharacterized protein n=1 Tax=Acropora cervicornis TaxID=6130 RepID=A0AAD9UYU3_ACRCE|nr:hypothetical protein P5673_023315 [Acropora cervicornis]